MIERRGIDTKKPPLAHYRRKNRGRVVLFFLFLLITEYWLCQFNEVETVLLQSFDKHLKCLLLAFIFEEYPIHICDRNKAGKGIVF